MRYALAIILLLHTSMLHAQHVSPADTVQIDKWLNDARILLNSDIDSARILAIAALSASEKIGYQKGIAKSYMRLGVVYTSSGKSDSALYYFKLAHRIRMREGDEKGSAAALREISSLYSSLSKPDSAFAYCFQALRINEKIGNKSEMAANYEDIGTLYLDFGNKAAARSYFEKAVNILEEIKDSAYLGVAYSKFGNYYYYQNIFDSALLYYSRALQINESTGNSIPAAQNIGSIASCYLYLKQYARSKQYYHKALAFDIVNNIQADIAIYESALGFVFKETNEKDSAVYYLNRAIDHAAEIGNRSLQAEAYETLSKVYELSGDYKTALEAHTRYADIKDSLLNEEKLKGIAEMQTKYETEKKDKEIGLLNKDNELKATEAGRQKQKFISSLIALAAGSVFFALVFYQKSKITKEKKRSDQLLLNILPAETADELKTTGRAKPKKYNSVTVLFTDFINFTQASEKLSPEELVDEINRCYNAFDNIVHRFAVEKIKTIGDSYMCAGGLPVSNTTHAKDVVRAALEMQRFIARNKEEQASAGLPYFELRLGIHTGPVVAGVVGTKKFAYDIWGDTVNTASRMESSGEAGKVNISQTTYELVKDTFSCIHRGKILAKNKGEIDMYFVEDV